MPPPSEGFHVFLFKLDKLPTQMHTTKYFVMIITLTQPTGYKIIIIFLNKRYQR